jgi:hypothetical protein
LVATSGKPDSTRSNGLVARLLLAMLMALQLGVDVVFAENIQQARLGVARETDETAGEFRQFLQRGRAFAFPGAQLHAGDQAAQVLITFARFRQQGISEWPLVQVISEPMCARMPAFFAAMWKRGAP